MNKRKKEILNLTNKKIKNHKPNKNLKIKTSAKRLLK